LPATCQEIQIQKLLGALGYLFLNHPVLHNYIIPFLFTNTYLPEHALTLIRIKFTS